MNSKNICFCCSKPMLRHINSSRAYWFCRSCWQEMPVKTLTETVYQTSKENYQFLVKKNAPIRISL